MTDTRPRLDPASEALVALGRARLYDDQRPAMDLDAYTAGLLPRIAQRHGMVAWLSPHRAPDRRAAQAWRDVVQAHRLQALARVQQLFEIVDALDRESIRVVVFKGIALSAWLYRDPCARRSADFDLLVRLVDRERAADILAGLGFLPALSRRGLDAIYANTGAWPLYRHGSCGVDLHWRVAARRFPAAVTADAVFAGACTVEVGGRRLRVPHPSHAAVLLLTHSAKHLWYALEQVFAIAHLARRDDIDWDEVLGLLTEAGAVRGAAAGLRLAADLFDAPVPRSFSAAVRHVPERLLADAYAALALPAGVFPDRWHVWRAQRTSCDRTAGRIAFDVRTLIEPTSLEWESVQLPPRLTFLYAPLRVLRLAAAAVQRKAPEYNVVTDAT